MMSSTCRTIYCTTLHNTAFIVTDSSCIMPPLPSVPHSYSSLLSSLPPSLPFLPFSLHPSLSPFFPACVRLSVSPSLPSSGAIHIITSSHYIAHADPLFAMTKLLKLDDLYKYQLGIFMHKVTHCQLPQNMSLMFLRTDNIYTVINSEIKMHITSNTNKTKHQESNNKLFWAEILEYSSCQSSTTCFHTLV